MTDGGALAGRRSPARSTRWRKSLAGVVTVGQAFGGDLEAVTVHTGLLAARHVLGADLAIVTQGPGNLGTGTPWGFSGVAAGEACNAVTVLGGQAIGALRISDADPRPRHRGVSHHSLTAFGRVALGGVTLVAPRGLGSELGAQVDEDLAGQPARNPVVWVDTDGLEDALGLSPVPLRTMGRGYAGGARLLPGRRGRRPLRRAAPCPRLPDADSEARGRTRARPMTPACFRHATAARPAAPRYRRHSGTSHAGDELVDAVVDGLERVLAQHGALGLVVELEVHPVDGEVAALLLGLADELAAQPGAGGLRRHVLGLEDPRLVGHPLDLAGPLQQVVQAAACG